MTATSRASRPSTTGPSTSSMIAVTAFGATIPYVSPQPTVPSSAVTFTITDMSVVG